MQRFFNATIPWLQVIKELFEQHLYRPAGGYFLAGDENVVTKSGKRTHGLDYFFSSLLRKTVKSIAIFSLALVGHFGNNNALQMVRQCGLHLISKLRHDAALHFIYDGEQKRRGPRKKYSQKINYRNMPKKYLVATSTQGQIKIRIYQAHMLHHDFAQALNVVIGRPSPVITKTNLKTGAFANVDLFASDLELSYEKIIDMYSLRFQIDFNFRDAKQYWGLEDFMNVNEIPLTNALNLALFMVNVSQALLRDLRQTLPESSVLDLEPTSGQQNTSRRQ